MQPKMQPAGHTMLLRLWINVIYIYSRSQQRRVPVGVDLLTFQESIYRLLALLYSMHLLQMFQIYYLYKIKGIHQMNAYLGSSIIRVVGPIPSKMYPTAISKT